MPKKAPIIVLGLSMVCIANAIHAEDAVRLRGTKSASYYGWLDRFENPTHKTATPIPQNLQPAVRKNPVGQRQRQEDAVLKRAPSVDESLASEENTVAGVVFEEDATEPGEGLGCYYHRAYYSHLPMFKDDVYSLRGSFDVAETFHKPSEEVVSSPDEVPHKK